MKQIRAVMADIDGTLLYSKGYVTSKTVKAIREARLIEIPFGLSTGRDLILLHYI